MMIFAPKGKHDVDTWTQWYKIGYSMGVYSWDDFPSDSRSSNGSPNQKSKKLSKKQSPSLALLVGFRAGRAARNYAR